MNVTSKPPRKRARPPGTAVGNSPPRTPRMGFVSNGTSTSPADPSPTVAGWTPPPRATRRRSRERWMRASSASLAAAVTDASASAARDERERRRPSPPHRRRDPTPRTRRERAAVRSSTATSLWGLQHSRAADIHHPQLCHLGSPDRHSQASHQFWPIGKLGQQNLFIGEDLMLLPTPLTYLFAFTVPGGDTAPASSLVLFGACAAVLSLRVPRPGDPARPIRWP